MSNVTFDYSKACSFVQDHEMEYMSELTGKNEEELFADLKGVIFRNPEHGEVIGAKHYMMADEYLSGNVREKLKKARRKICRNSSMNLPWLTTPFPPKMINSANSTPTRPMSWPLFALNSPKR